MGIFSVLAYLVGQRTRELAIRRALGARTVDIIPLIIGQGLRLVAIGLVLGLAGALTLARLMTVLLFEISPWDAGTYLGTIAVLGGAARRCSPRAFPRSEPPRSRHSSCSSKSSRASSDAKLVSPELRCQAKRTDLAASPTNPRAFR